MNRRMIAVVAFLVALILVGLLLHSDGWQQQWGWSFDKSLLFSLAALGLVAWFCAGTLQASRTPSSQARAIAPNEFKVHGLGPLSADSDSAQLYLDLMKRTVANFIYQDTPLLIYDDHGPRLATEFKLEQRVTGFDAPTEAHTMIGWHRLDNLQACVETTLRENVPGDYLEAGSYRGGAAIFMRAILKAHQIEDRRVLACDAFRSFRPQLPPQPILAIGQALAAIPFRSWRRWYFHFLERCNKDSPFPKADNPSDDWIDLTLWQLRHSSVLTNLPDNNLELVESRFASYGLLDEQVVLLQGFFADTLPTAPVEQLAVLRLDGDTYESTIEPLSILYPKLSAGGFCIVDDYYAFEACRQAIDEYRAKHDITDELIKIDAHAVYWRKT